MSTHDVRQALASILATGRDPARKHPDDSPAKGRWVTFTVRSELVDAARAALAEQPASVAVERLRNLAEHLRHCRECGETDVSNCPEGEALWDASMPQPAAEIGATPPAAPKPEDTK